MLVWQTDFIIADVDYRLWEEFPSDNHKKSFPFYLQFTVQINGKVKRTRTSFEVYSFNDESIPVHEKLDLKILHTAIDVFRDLWYDIGYSNMINEIESFVNYQMSQIHKYMQSKN